MPFTLRKNAWVFSSSELLTSAVFVVFFLLALGGAFTGREGADHAFYVTVVYCLVWIGWMYFVALRKPSPLGLWGLFRGLGPWLGLVLCYSLIKYLVPVVHPQQYDSSLNSMDLSLFGRGAGSFGHALEGHPHWTDLFCLFYLSLFLWLVGLLVYHSWLRRALYQRFMLGLILIYIGGFIGYVLYPAIGPRFAYPQDWTWLSGGIIFRWSNVLIAGLGSKFDVFPSLHGALSAYLLFWQLRHDRRGLTWGLPLTVGIWLSTLFLGFHYFPDLISGGLLAGVSSWAAPEVEILVGAYRRTLHPPRVWLLSLTEGHGDAYGKLAGRLSELIPLGAETAPGFITGNVSRARGEAVVRQALGDLGKGPYWVRPSDESGSKKSSLSALKPLSTEQTIRQVFDAKAKRFFIVQKALKVSAVGVCRAFPSKGLKLNDVEIRVTALPRGEVLILRLTPNKTLFKGWIDTPWNYFPKSFPLRGYELFEVVQLTRRLAAKWGRLTEVEWILADGKVYSLDGRAVKAVEA